MDQKQFEKRLFSLLEDIDNKVPTIKKKAILLVGVSKVGLSTCFNWALGHPLLVQKQNCISNKTGKRIQSTKYSYVSQVMWTQSAEIKNGYVSCTVVPNVADFTRSYRDASLIDMPGFENTTDFIGTLGAYYSLKAVFEAVEQAKFVIVISEKSLHSHTQLCKTFQHFLSMFNFSQISQKIKMSIFKSTSLLITKSSIGFKHYQMIEECIMLLDQPEINNIQNKELIVELLRYIHYENMFVQFQMASGERFIQRCNIFNNLQNRNWPYFQLKDIDQAQVVALPFQRQFKYSTKEEREKLLKALDNTFLAYQNFTNILIEAFYDKLVVLKIHNIEISHRSFFLQIDKLIKDQQIQQCLNLADIPQIKFEKPQKILLFHLILEMKSNIMFDQFDANFSPSKTRQMILAFENKIKQLIQIISVIFCRNKDDYKKMVIVKHILLKRFHQFYLLKEVDPNYFTVAINRICNSLQSVAKQGLSDYLSRFLQSFQILQQARIIFGPKNINNSLEQYLSSRECAYSLDFVFEVYKNQFILLEDKDKDILYQLLRDTKIIHAKYEYKFCHYQQSIQYLLSAMQMQLKYQEKFLERMNKNGYQCLAQESNGRAMRINQQNIFKMIQQNLIRMNKLEISLYLSIYFRWVDSVCQIYELILKSDKIPQEEKLNRMKDYAQYSMEHGRVEKGRGILQKLLQAQNCQFKQKIKIISLIIKTINHESYYIEKYAQFLNSYANFSVKNEETQQLMGKVKDLLWSNHSQKSEVIEITKECLLSQQFNQQNKSQLLAKYLQKKCNNTTVADQNGFTIKYLKADEKIGQANDKKIECINEIYIKSREELQGLSCKLLKTLEAAAKTRVNANQQQFIQIKFGENIREFQQIILRRLAIVLKKKKNAEYTFENAMKTMNIIRKIAIVPHEKLLQIIKISRQTLENIGRYSHCHIQLMQKQVISEHTRQQHKIFEYVLGDSDNTKRRQNY